MAESTRVWAEQGAAVVLAAFESYRERFANITMRARRHFGRQDWSAAQRDSARRLDVYGECVAEGMNHLRTRLGALAEDRATWNGMREAYRRRVAERGDAELGETFFNSCVRLAFHIVGVDPDMEFVAIRDSDAPGRILEEFTETFPRVDRLDTLVREALEHHAFSAPVGRPRGRRAASGRRDRG